MSVHQSPEKNTKEGKKQYLLNTLYIHNFAMHHISESNIGLRLDSRKERLKKTNADQTSIMGARCSSPRANFPPLSVCFCPAPLQKKLCNFVLYVCVCVCVCVCFWVWMLVYDYDASFIMWTGVWSDAVEEGRARDLRGGGGWGVKPSLPRTAHPRNQIKCV